MDRKPVRILIVTLCLAASSTSCGQQTELSITCPPVLQQNLAAFDNLIGRIDIFDAAPPHPSDPTLDTTEAYLSEELTDLSDGEHKLTIELPVDSYHVYLRFFDLRQSTKQLELLTQFTTEVVPVAKGTVVPFNGSTLQQWDEYDEDNDGMTNLAEIIANVDPEDPFDTACDLGPCQPVPLAQDVTRPLDVTLDDTHVYWRAGEELRRVPKDDSDTASFLSQDYQGGPFLVDEAYVYWYINQGGGAALWRQPKDGSGSPESFATFSEYVAHFAMDSSLIFFRIHLSAHQPNDCQSLIPDGSSCRGHGR